MRSSPLTPWSALCLASLVAATGCGNEISSDEQARRAYLGLDDSIEKALQLGFAGFNAANSANISPQSISGGARGTLTVTGQVDQGASANKGMRLRVGMTEYSDGEIEVGEGETVEIVYDTPTTPESQPTLNLSLRDIPNGTFTGGLAGDFTMTGDLEGNVTLNLQMAGNLEDAGGGAVRRAPGTTTVTGTATSSGGTYAVDLTL